MQMRSRAMPASSREAARSRQPIAHVGHHVVVGGSILHGRGFPCICMTTRPQARSRTSPTIAGSRKPDTSLTTAAPASRHASATAACRVSMLTHTPRAASSRTAGTTRASSSASVTGAAPGRVDSPPTSMICAPFVEHALGVRDRRIERVVRSPVGEGVGGHVENAHQNGHSRVEFVG